MNHQDRKELEQANQIKMEKQLISQQEAKAFYGLTKKELKNVPSMKLENGKVYFSTVDIEHYLEERKNRAGRGMLLSKAWKTFIQAYQEPIGI